jgi:hypothetical protein
MHCHGKIGNDNEGNNNAKFHIVRQIVVSKIIPVGHILRFNGGSSVVVDSTTPHDCHSDSCRYGRRRSSLLSLPFRCRCLCNITNSCCSIRRACATFRPELQSIRNGIVAGPIRDCHASALH